MKDLNQANPADNNVRWHESIKWADISQANTWYTFRIIGGFYSIGTHWIPITTKEGRKTRFPIECVNWCQEKERAVLDNGCHACANELKITPKYLLNVIDRQVQEEVRAGVSPIRGLQLSSGAMAQVLKLNKLNKVDGKLYSINDAVYGQDVNIDWTPKGQFKDWHASAGERKPLTEEEKLFKTYDFEALYLLPEPADVLDTLKRLKLLKDTNGVSNGTTTSVQVPADLNVQMPDVGVEETPTPSQNEDTTGASDNFQQSLTAGEDNTNVVVEEPVTQTATETVAVNTPPPTEVNVSGDENIQRPDCFPVKAGMAFKGQLDCMRCPVKEDCIAATNKFSA